MFYKKTPLFISRMKGIILAAACLIITSRAQESTIPVGVEGRDTLTQIRTQDSEGNYDFGYNENQLTGGASFMREKGTANGRKEGSYGYTTRNGLIRIVTYVADENGFRAEVLTNEPGVIAANPSNITVTKEKEPDPDSLSTSQTPSPQTSLNSEVVSDSRRTGPGYTHPSYVPTARGSSNIMFVSPYAQYSIMSNS